VRRYLALGDSYTIGEGVSDQEAWPNQLVRLLVERGVDIGPAHIIARTAWTTDELSDAIDAERPRSPFDLVTLQIGVNDQYRSRPIPPFASEFAALLKRARGFGANRASRVIAVSIPDWSATPYAEGRDRSRIAAEIESYNQRARELAEAAKVAWVDVTEISRAMLTDPTLVAVDGLHPTGAMYKLWAERVLPVALMALNPGTSPGGGTRDRIQRT
jgi:lysophospholipase L1-like esterase